MFAEQNKLVVSDQFGCLSLLKIDGESIKVERQRRVHDGPCYKVVAFQDGYCSVGTDGYVKYCDKTFAVLEEAVIDGEINCIDTCSNMFAVGDDMGIVRLFGLDE